MRRSWTIITFESVLRMAISIPLLLISAFILQADIAISIEDWKLFMQPSRFLGPPPISRSYRNHYLASKQQKQATSRVQNTRSVHGKWYDPRKPWPTFIDSVPKFTEYTYHELHCNPCNNVPWIPVITLNPAKIISPQQPHQAHPSPLNSYYHTFNKMTSNLARPINVLAPTLPFYVGTPVYQQHIQNPAWHSGPTVVDGGSQQPNNAAPVFSVPAELPPKRPNLGHISPVISLQNDNHLASGWNLPNDMAFSSMANHNSPLFDLPSAETNRNLDASVASAHWLNGAKPIPVLHYRHTIEYPAQFSTVPSTDLSVHATSSAKVTPAPLAAIYADDSADSLHDISNNLDDTRYSSSENKFSITTNETAKGVRHLKGNETEVKSVFNSTGLTEYLTPPVLSESNEWRLPDHKEESPKPLENWSFLNELKPEKRKKQIQIVIPYTLNKINKHDAKQFKSNETNWNSMVKVRDVWAVASTTTSSTVLPIIRYLRDNVTTKKQDWTDWQKLRKAIDTWTVEGFSNHKYGNLSSQPDITTSASPATWLTSKDGLRSEVTFQNENRMDKENPAGIQNRISSGVTKTDETKSNSKLWNTLPTTVSAITKEKVFIVTPVPLAMYNFSSNDFTNENWKF